MLKRSRFISTGTEEAASSNDNTWGFIDGTVRVVCRPSHQDPIKTQSCRTTFTTATIGTPNAPIPRGVSTVHCPLTLMFAESTR